jgi:hypothetical protein
MIERIDRMGEKLSKDKSRNIIEHIDAMGSKLLGETVKSRKAKKR